MVTREVATLTVPFPGSRVTDPRYSGMRECITVFCTVWNRIGAVGEVESSTPAMVTS